MRVTFAHSQFWINRPYSLGWRCVCSWPTSKTLCHWRQVQLSQDCPPPTPPHPHLALLTLFFPHYPLYVPSSSLGQYIPICCGWQWIGTELQIALGHLIRATAITWRLKKSASCLKVAGSNSWPWEEKTRRAFYSRKNKQPLDVKCTHLSKGTLPIIYLPMFRPPITDTRIMKIPRLRGFKMKNCFSSCSDRHTFRSAEGFCASLPVEKHI